MTHNYSSKGLLSSSGTATLIVVLLSGLWIPFLILTILHYLFHRPNVDQHNAVQSARQSILGDTKL